MTEQVWTMALFDRSEIHGMLRTYAKNATTDIGAAGQLHSLSTGKSQPRYLINPRRIWDSEDFTRTVAWTFITQTTCNRSEIRAGCRSQRR